MKTLFEIKIHAFGSQLEDIVKIIANHNSGKCTIDIDVICAFLIAKKAMYPEALKGLFIKTEGGNGQTILLSDDGGITFYLTLTEVETCSKPEDINYLPTYKNNQK